MFIELHRPGEAWTMLVAIASMLVVVPMGVQADTEIFLTTGQTIRVTESVEHITRKLKEAQCVIT